MIYARVSLHAYRLFTFFRHFDIMWGVYWISFSWVSRLDFLINLQNVHTFFPRFQFEKKHEEANLENVISLNNPITQPQQLCLFCCILGL